MELTMRAANPNQAMYLISGAKIVLIPPSLTFILRQRLANVCPLGFRTFFNWRHCVATPSSVSPILFTSAEVVKWKQELDESWQARVCVRVSSTLVSWSNESKSCMRVDKREFSLRVSSTLVSWSNESKSCMRVDKREFSLRVSSTLVSWSNDNKSCMRVDKREFTWEFHQLSYPGQTRARVAWELTSESLHESIINSRVLVKREQELHESWQARVSSTLMSRGWSDENKSFVVLTIDSTLARQYDDYQLNVFKRGFNLCEQRSHLGKRLKGKTIYHIHSLKRRPRISAALVHN